MSTLVIGACNATQLRENLGSVEFKLTPEQVKRLDDASASQPVYPYWYQRQTFAERNPRPVNVSAARALFMPTIAQSLKGE